MQGVAGQGAKAVVAVVSRSAPCHAGAEADKSHKLLSVCDLQREFLSEENVSILESLGKLQAEVQMHAAN